MLAVAPGLRPRPAFAANKALFPDADASRIRIGQTLTGSIPDASVLEGTREFVWGAHAPHYGGLAVGYMPGLRDHDPAHTIGWYQANRPDWVMYGPDRTSYVDCFDAGYVMLDITNPACREYQLQWALSIAAGGYSAVGLDNIDIDNNPMAVGHYTPGGTWVEQYGPGAYEGRYNRALLDYVNWMHQQLNSRGIPMIANCAMRWTHNVEDAHAIARCCDGILVEGCFLNASTKYLDDFWLAQLEVHWPYTQDHVFHASVSLTPPETLATISTASAAWALANFLLVKGPWSYVWVGSSVSPTSEYGIYQGAYPASLTPAVGAPAGDPARAGDAWTRTYEHGFVAVNPWSNRAVACTIPAGTWRDQFGNSVPSGAATLAAASGLVLVRQ